MSVSNTSKRGVLKLGVLKLGAAAHNVEANKT
jgi:hypothetical protein